MKQNLLVTVLVGVIALGAGFGGGYAFKNYQLSKMRTQFAGRFGMNGAMGMGRGRMFGGGVLGSVIAQDDKSITVKMSDGSTKIVLLSGSTTYVKSSLATKSDISVGTTVSVFGMPNSDGSVTAQNIQINPPMRPSPSPAAK